MIRDEAVRQLFLSKLLDLHRAGRFLLDSLVRSDEFEEIERTFENSKQGRTIRPILRIVRS